LEEVEVEVEDEQLHLGAPLDIGKAGLARGSQVLGPAGFGELVGTASGRTGVLALRPGARVVSWTVPVSTNGGAPCP
jgi:hypothetical protein